MWGSVMSSLVPYVALRSLCMSLEFLEIFGCLWVSLEFLDIFGCLWMSLDVFGCLWMSLDVFVDLSFIWVSWISLSVFENRISINFIT